MWSDAEQRWKKRDLDTFDQLPKSVRDAIRQSSNNVDVHALKSQAKTAAAMIKLIKSGAAPR